MSEPYLTRPELKATLNLVNESFADDDIDLALSAASATVDSTCGRTFSEGAAHTAREYAPRRADWVEIDDLLVVDSVEAKTIGVPGDYTAWDPADYELYPLNAEADGRPYTELKLPLYSAQYPFYGAIYNAQYPLVGKRVRITGTFGWSTVPDAVKQATGIYAARLLKRSREAPFGVTSIGADAVAMRIARTDPDVVALLAPYSRSLRLA